MRLVTRSDFDGLGCAAILKEKGIIDDITFVHPKDIQDGRIEITCDDILANIPFVPDCGIWFDHHSSEQERKTFGNFEGNSEPSAPSAARVVYEYYGGLKHFKNEHLDDLIRAVDKADAAQFTKEEILNPEGWVLLSFIMDPRTGLGRYKDYRISNYALMMDMIDYCRNKTDKEILEIPDIKERTVRYFEQDKLFRQMLLGNSRMEGNVVILDLREQDEIYTGNRFLLYSLFPDANISIQIMWGFQRRNIVITCGYSIINKTARADVGSLMLKYGGGGHRRVGTCQVPIDTADDVIKVLLGELNKDADPVS
ncbi:exopolyphosphatase [Desulfobacter hydrogenophilus]|uniref:Exopolyphosphatase n=1 Tax=Desulfobacter hydrogenophilus TaxID=2291 RepID=A0A328FG02_9BACT|nr:exopolyphosphatase [Desulfobacter hydrogenophilus]NDY72052.1 exopolyphosphatase [Desulfobacter hydrogenophilus]QBH11474.1 exopolyphosphatase [Desulfobacter hydrogenophilus]RAM01973.1 exopolyphosphatase [Desulfobacter hydrogenophilus]